MPAGDRDDPWRALNRLILVDGVPVHTGGLLACCLQTIRRASVGTPHEPPENQVRACSDCGECVVFRAGAWTWLPTHPKKGPDDDNSR